MVSQTKCEYEYRGASGRDCAKCWVTNEFIPRGDFRIVQTKDGKSKKFCPIHTYHYLKTVSPTKVTSNSTSHHEINAQFDKIIRVWCHHREGIFRWSGLTGKGLTIGGQSTISNNEFHFSDVVSEGPLTFSNIEGSNLSLEKFQCQNLNFRNIKLAKELCVMSGDVKDISFGNSRNSDGIFEVNRLLVSDLKDVSKINVANYHKALKGESIQISSVGCKSLVLECGAWDKVRLRKGGFEEVHLGSDFSARKIDIVGPITIVRELNFGQLTTSEIDVKEVDLSKGIFGYSGQLSHLIANPYSNVTINGGEIKYLLARNNGRVNLRVNDAAISQVIGTELAGDTEWQFTNSYIRTFRLPEEHGQEVKGKSIFISGGKINDIEIKSHSVDPEITISNVERIELLDVREAVFKNHFRIRNSLINTAHLEMADFNSKLDLGGAVFEQAPSFYKVSLHAGVKISSATNFLDRSEEATEAYRFLRVLMSKEKSLDLAGYFHRLELKCAAKRSWSTLVWFRLYDVCSKCGQSMVRPILVLFISYLVFSSLFCVFSSTCSLTPVPESLDWRISQFTLQQMFRPFYIWSDVKKHLSFMNLVEWKQLLVASVASVYSLICVGLVAVFIFALRRRFKLPG